MTILHLSLRRTPANPPNQPNATKVGQKMKTRSATILATIITSLVAFTSASDVLAQGTWTTIAPIPLPTSGVASYEASGVSLGGKFYVIDYGVGYGNPLPLNVYDLVTDSWSLKAADPVLRAETAAGVINNKIYVAEGWGGTYGSDSNAPTTALEIYDPATDSWTAGAPSLVARGWSATAVIGGKLYITGGTTYFQNPAIATLEIYDPNSNTWSTGAPIPVAPKKAVGAALNGKFYVVGGGVGAGLIATANVYIYDPTTDTWTPGVAMPSPRFGAAGGVINGKLYITGGNITVTDGTDNPVVVYDPITDTWSAGGAEPTPRYAAAAAAVGCKLFVAGGLANSTTVTSTAEAFTPDCCDKAAQIQQPINFDESSVFNVRRGVVPVKFTLTCNGVATCALPPATIALTRTAGGTIGAIDENVYTGSADTGSTFRIDSCQYVYNLSANALGVGTYRVDIQIDGQVVGSGVFQLK
jgi:Kelch motif